MYRIRPSHPFKNSVSPPPHAILLYIFKKKKKTTKKPFPCSELSEEAFINREPFVLFLLFLLQSDAADGPVWAALEGTGPVCKTCDQNRPVFRASTADLNVGQKESQLFIKSKL